MRQAELFFAFDHVALGAACIQLDGQIVYANAILADMLGFTREQLVQQRFQDLICPDDLATSLTPFEQLMAGEVSHYTIEVRYRHCVGHWVWVKLSVSLIPAFAPHEQPLLLGQMSDITVRKQQEDELFLEQQRLRQAESLAHLGSWEMELVTGDCWWSEEFYRLCDYPPETPPSFDAYMARIHPEDQEAMGEAVRHAILKAQPFSLEIRLRLPEEQIRWVIARGAVELHAHLPSRLRGHLFDISDLKQQMNQKHQQEQVLASFYRSAPFMMGIVALYPDGDLLHLYDNPQTAAFFGTTPEFLAGKKASVLQTPPDILARWWQLYQRSGELGLPLRMEYVHPLPDREAWLQVTVMPINVQEQLYCYIAEDITEQKQNYERLKASESRFSGIFNTMYTLMGMLSPQGELLEVNQIALGMIQQPAEAVLGKLLWQTPWFQGLPEAQAAMQGAVDQAARGEFVRYETEIRYADNLLAVDVSLRPVKNEAGEVTSLIAEGRDISEIKRQREALEQSNRELQEFAYVVSHDLQEPVRKILAFGQLLQEHLEPSAALQHDYLQRCIQAATRMQELIRALLAYSRLSEQLPQPQAVDLGLVLGEVCENLELRIHEQHAQIEVAPLPRVMADHVKMTQLFQNLLSNSLKFVHPDRAPLIRLSVHQLKAAEVVLLLEDNGVGFAPEEGERIFNIFQRLEEHRAYPGTGIGLATCRKIVEQHHGSIAAEGLPGRGARFLITLPLALPESLVSQVSTPLETVGTPAAWPERILLVDDDEEEYLLLQVMLQRQSPNSLLVWEAHLEAGLHRLLNESWDLALIDYYLGAEDGLQLIRAARAQGVNTALFLRSGREDPDLVARARREGANGVIAKSTLLTGSFTPLLF